MLKTFELKMKQSGIKRITREHQGRIRYDTWRMDCGIEFLTIHSNEHLSALTINTYTVAKALAESKDQYFTLKGFEEVMKFLDITYLPVHQNGEFLGHGLYFQPKETWFTSVAKDGRAGNFSQAPDFGFCASQNTYYFGYKLHALCGLSGVIHSYDLSKASVADLHYMKDVKHTYHDCSIYGDKGYIGADVQLDLFETAHIRLECPYRLNQKDWKPTFIPFAKARKRIETIFSQLTDQFLVIRNYAKITNGLFARIIGKISALTILQYVNFINDKPIGRIKYALN
jgi:hypothetical protein